MINKIVASLRARPTMTLQGGTVQTENVQILERFYPKMQKKIYTLHSPL
jgi:hypothetical protein